jgi:hypothetical protein
MRAISQAGQQHLSLWPQYTIVQQLVVAVDLSLHSEVVQVIDNADMALCWPAVCTALRTKEDERIHMQNTDELTSLLKPQGKKAKADQLILAQTGGNMHIHHDMEEATTQSGCSDVGVGQAAIIRGEQ